MDMIINFLWIGNRLTDIGILSLISFNKLGYKCVLWSYNNIENVPNFVKVKDANEIVEQKDGNVKIFSDYFRYKLIYKHGGVYSDLDNILLKRLPEQEYILSGSLKHGINSHLLRAPKGASILKDVIYEIEKNMVFDYTKVFNGLNLLNKIEDSLLKEFAIDEMDSFKDSSILRKEEIDWSIYMCAHLYESTHRVSLRNNELYKRNLNNLKKIINE